MDVLLEYIDLQSYFSHALPIMLAFSYYAGITFDALATYYAQCYAGIIGWSLPYTQAPIQLEF